MSLNLTNMNFVYHIGLYIFKFLLIIASPFNLRAKKWIAGRKNLFNKISSQLKSNEKRIWIHAASLGEFEQGRPVIEEIKKQWPDLKIVLTFFSPSGYEIRKDYELADYVFYLPLDTRSNANKFIELIKPEFAIFIKYEFWFNFLYSLRKKNIPTYLISAIFRKDQVFFRPWGIWYRKVIGYFEWLFVQNQVSLELLYKFGYKNASISGDTRFDRVHQIGATAKNIPIVEKFKDGQFTIIIGSSWKADEEILFDFINGIQANTKFIIAPHEIHEANIERITNNLKVNYQRFSKADLQNVSMPKVLIIDNIGLLSSIYQYGKIAYIGGGFGSGIHNVLEASTFGQPVLFGPNYKKYQEAVDLIKLGGAFEVNKSGDVKEILNKLIADKAYLEKASAISRKYVEDNRGACKTIMEYLKLKHNDLA
jgi:3-deoxy-D-manno-octulosonic-acid transferase